MLEPTNLNFTHHPEDQQIEQALLSLNADTSDPLLGKRRTSDFDHRLGYLIFLLLGCAPQLVQNALFSETAIFKQEQPEGRNISAYMITAFMLANIFCLVYLFLQRFVGISDKVYVYIILFGNFFLCCMITVYWKHTKDIHPIGDLSIVLIICSFFAGALGNVSTLVFFSFATQYRPYLTSALSTGYGVSGLITSGLALTQNPTKMRFGVDDYFAAIAGVLAVSIIVFMMIAHSNWAHRLRADAREQDDTDTESAFSEESDRPIPYGAVFGILFIMFWVSMLTFFIPALIPYTGRNDEEMAYLNAIFLVFPPIGALLVGWFKFYALSVTTAVQTIAFLFLVLPALDATKDVLPFYGWLLYCLLMLFGLLSGYTTTMIYLKLRKDLAEYPLYIDKIARFAAFANQLGAIVGILLNDVIIISKLYYHS